MRLRLLYFLFIVPFLVSCGEDEPKNNLFSLDSTIVEGEASIKLGTTTCIISYDGWGGTCYVDLYGDFDSYTLSEDLPTWITVKTQIPNKLVLLISETHNGERTGKIGFTVFKGKQSEAGSITIDQSALSEQDFINRQNKAIQKYLSNFSVEESLPSDLWFKTGEDAPFYKIENADCTCYMQVVSRGTGNKAAERQLIYVRFLRYNLVSYLQNSVLPIPDGNANSLDASPISFRFNQPSQLGWAIQMPLRLDLPIDSEVNLIIPAEFGFSGEQSYYIPYLYNVKYFPAVN